MGKLSPYAKAIVALIVACAAWAAAAVVDGTISPAEWGGLAGAVATSLGVFLVPNGGGGS